MPIDNRNCRKEWQEERIPNARFFDYDQTICDLESELPHMLPTAEVFTEHLRQLGVNQNSTVVIYDTAGVFSSPRAWWMMQAMGHKNTAVLNGGLPAWKAQGHPTEKAGLITPVQQGNFIATLNPALVSNADDVLSATQDATIAILDARSEDRFFARAAEPRAGLRKGHMPRAKNLPFQLLITDGLMKSAEELSPIFDNLLTNENKLIASCGSGVTASIIALAADVAGLGPVSVYDGSWAEWGASNDLPIVS